MSLNPNNHCRPSSSAIPSCLLASLIRCPRPGRHGIYYILDTWWTLDPANCYHFLNFRINMIYLARSFMDICKFAIMPKLELQICNFPHHPFLNTLYWWGAPHIGVWSSIFIGYLMPTPYQPRVNMLICLKTWQAIWSQAGKSSICTLYKENAYKCLKFWYPTPDVLHVIYPSIWSCHVDKGTLFHTCWSGPLIAPFWHSTQQLLTCLSLWHQKFPCWASLHWKLPNHIRSYLDISLRPHAVLLPSTGNGALHLPQMPCMLGSKM